MKGLASLGLIILLSTGLLLYPTFEGEAWGFFGHRRINRLAVFSLPPQMVVWYKRHIDFLTEHAPDPDKMRYAIEEEGAHHFIDIDYYGAYPFAALPRDWDRAVEKFGRDTLIAYGIVPWHAQTVFLRLRNAFSRKDENAVLRQSTYLGHYIADAAVPLHANNNYDGKLTGQKGIHALWESEIPELFADTSFNLWVGKAEYIEDPENYIWNLVLESAQAADTALAVHKKLMEESHAGAIRGFIERREQTISSYTVDFAKKYNERLNGMVERRMRKAIWSVASLWYTAWIDAGQPDLEDLINPPDREESQSDFEELDRKWRNREIRGREHID